MKRCILAICLFALGVSSAAGEPFASSGRYWKKYAKRYGIVVMAGNVGERTRHYGWYWNDTYRMVKLLRDEGFPRDCIYFLAYGKKANEHKDEVYGTSTTDNIRRVLKKIAGLAGPEDLVYLYWIDHGNWRALNTYDGAISHAELGKLFRAIKARSFIGAFNPCYSGALIDDVHSPNAIIITSTSSKEGNSWGWAGHWRLSLQGGKKGNHSDADGDCRITMAEAYRWTSALANKKGEHPQIDDNGDGKPGDLSAGSFDAFDPGRDGFRAARFGLDAWRAPLPSTFAWKKARIQGASGPETDAKKRLAAFLGKQEFVRKALDGPGRAKPMLVYCYSRARKQKKFTPEALQCLEVNRKVFSLVEAEDVAAAGACFTCVEADVTEIDGKGSPDINASTVPAVVLLDRSGALSAFLEGKDLTREILYKEMKKLVSAAERSVLDKIVQKVMELTQRLKSFEKNIAAKKADVLNVIRQSQGKKHEDFASIWEECKKTIRNQEANYAECVEKLRILLSR